MFRSYRDTHYARFINAASIPDRHSQTTANLDGEWGNAWERIKPVLGKGSLVGVIGTRGTGKTRIGVASIRHTCATVAARIAGVEVRFGDGPRATIERNTWLSERGEALGADARYAIGYPDRSPCIYTTAMGLFLDIRSTYGRGSGSEKEIIERLCVPQLLVIDEIQERSNTDWENRILTHIIDQRYAALRDTIIIGNLTTETLSSTLGASFTDRLYECGLIVECKWRSFRKPEEKQ